MDWALKNCMKFHPSKCKVIMVSKSRMSYIDILPLVQFYYSIGREIIDYCETEKDLGIHINGTLNLVIMLMFYTQKQVKDLGF